MNQLQLESKLQLENDDYLNEWYEASICEICDVLDGTIKFYIENTDGIRKFIGIEDEKIEVYCPSHYSHVEDFSSILKEKKDNNTSIYVKFMKPNKVPIVMTYILDMNELLTSDEKERWITPNICNIEELEKMGKNIIYNISFRIPENFVKSRYTRKGLDVFFILTLPNSYNKEKIISNISLRINQGIYGDFVIEYYNLANEVIGSFRVLN